MDNLKPCQFCGGEAKTAIADSGAWSVICPECLTGIFRPRFNENEWDAYRTEAEAIKAWNTRADDRSQAAAYWQRAYEETVRERTCKREEIVRCRDCQHMHTVRSWLGNDVDECWLHADRESGALGKNRTEPDGFCAWAERKAVASE